MDANPAEMDRPAPNRNALKPDAWPDYDWEGGRANRPVCQAQDQAATSQTLAQRKQQCYHRAMPTLYVRDIPERIYRQARKIAAVQGRSLSAYVLTVLEQAVEDEKLRRTRSKALTNIRRRRRSLPASAPDSVTLLRHIRGKHE